MADPGTITMSEKLKPKGGWVCLYRSLLTSEVWEDHNLTRVFIWCLLKANHKPRDWRGQIIQRGSFVTSTAKAASEIDLSRTVIARALKRLAARRMIATKAAQRYTLVSVCNYETYQQPQIVRGTKSVQPAVRSRYDSGTSAVQARYEGGHKQQITINNPSIPNRTETLRSPNPNHDPDTQTPPEATQDPPAPPVAAAAPESAQEDPSFDGRMWSDRWEPMDGPPPPPRFEIRPVDEHAVPPGVIPAYDPHRLAMSRWVVEIPNIFADVKAMIGKPVDALPLPRSCDAGRVFEWLKPEHLLPGGNGPLNVVRWFRTQLSAEAPVFRDNQADLLFALCCHAAMKSAEHRIRNRVGYFAKLCTTQTPEQWRVMARHYKGLVNSMPRLLRESNEKPRAS